MEVRLSIEARGWRLELTNEPVGEAVHVAEVTSEPVEVDASQEPIDREGWIVHPFGFGKKGTA